MCYCEKFRSAAREKHGKVHKKLLICRALSRSTYLIVCVCVVCFIFVYGGFGSLFTCAQANTGFASVVGIAGIWRYLDTFCSIPYYLHFFKLTYILYGS